MKLRMRIVTGSLLLLVVVLCVACSSSETKPSEPNYEQLKEANKKLQDQIREQEHQNKTAGDEDLAKKVKELEAENEKLTKKVEQLQSSKASSKGTSTSSSTKGKELSAEEIVDLFFWEAEKPYEMRDQEFNFYSDRSCKKEFIIRKDLTFVNFFDYEIVDPDTNEKAYITKSYEEGIVYSRERPFFNQIE